MESSSYKFLRKHHITFLKRCLSVLPARTSSYDTSRMTVLFFTLSGLDVLGAIDDLPKSQKEEIIDWIYSLQLTSADGHSVGGFRGGHCLTNIETFKSCSNVEAKETNSAIVIERTCNGPAECSTNFSMSNGGLDVRLGGEKLPSELASRLDTGHITMTYTALMSLIILGDDLSRIDRPALLLHVKSLQCPDGSFFSNAGGSENDLRFVYCAAAVCYVLGDFSSINVSAAVSYILGCFGYAGGLGQGALQESHGGSTYCGLAALQLLSTASSSGGATLSLKQRKALTRWLLLRQEEHLNKQDEDVNTVPGGLQGRPNKPADSCYTFWVGAALKMLGASNMLDGKRLLNFVLSTQDPITGGLAKHSGAAPDGLHTYLALSGLATLALQPDLREVEPSLNITMRALKHLHRLCRQEVVSPIASV